MRRCWFIIAALWPCVTQAGEIYGTLTLDGKPLTGVRIEMIIPGFTYGTQTDKSGGFRLYVKEEGKFPIVVHYQGQTLAKPAISFPESARYDLFIERRGTEWVLQRK